MEQKTPLQPGHPNRPGSSVSESEISRLLQKLAESSASDPSSSRRTQIPDTDQAPPLAGPLSHPNILSASAADRWSGVTLEDVLKNVRNGDAETMRVFSLGRLLAVFQKVCDAVAFAHSRCVVHRSLTTSSVWLGMYGEVCVAAFETSEQNAKGADPAQQEKEIAADITALGALLYEILTLQPPARASDGKVPHPSTFNATNLKRRKHLVIEEAEEVALTHYACDKIPEPLAATCAKALTSEGADRYRTVEELQNEIYKFQSRAVVSVDGTGDPNRWHRLFRLYRREVVLLGLGTAAIVAVAGGVLARLYFEPKHGATNDTQMQEAMRGAARTFRSQARDLVAERKLDEALDTVSTALLLAPDDAASHALKGDILQSSLRLGEARDAYRQALRHNPQQSFVAENLDLCERLVAANAGGQGFSPTTLLELQTAMRRQRRFSNAAAMQRRLEGQKQELLDTWNDRLKRSALGPKLEAANRRLAMDESGVLSLNLKGLPIDDVSALKGMPLTSLDLSETKVSDLGALERMPLTVLRVNKTAVKDLSPLRGMALDQLDASETSVHDLEPLRGMPLTWLCVTDTAVGDLRPLEGMPLKVLYLVRTQVKDISPVKDMPLEQFAVAVTGVTDLSSLKGKKITYLMMQLTAIEDLSPLEGMPLLTFHLQYTPVKDISSLRGMPLRYLVFQGCANIGDIRVLSECKDLERLCLPPNCKDVEFLRGFPKLTHLGYVYSPILNPSQRWPQTAAEFWKEYDAKKRIEDGG